MEVKKNLNNVQRKMLDQIYSEQFEFKRKSIMDAREAGLKELAKEVQKEVSAQPEVAAFLKAYKALQEQFKAIKPTLETEGVQISGRFDANEPEVSEPSTYVYASRPENSKVAAYNDRTQEISRELNEKKQIIRSAIYGMETDYESVKAEIEAVLSTINA